jgi:hypothetical protein
MLIAPVCLAAMTIVAAPQTATSTITTSTSAADVPEPKDPEPPPPLAPEEAPQLERRLAVGTSGFFQPGILLQGWFVAQRGITVPAKTTTTFRLRRAEIAAKGEIVPDVVAYAVMFDVAKVLEPRDETFEVAGESLTVKQPVSALAVMQDLIITLKSTWVDASIGQFKIPVSWEGFNSTTKLLFPERATVAREFGDKRDLGLRLAKTFEYFGYSAGLFNGAALNALDTNNGKDFGLRLEVYPLKELVIAGVLYRTIGDRDQAGAKDRYEVDFRYERGPFLLQAEYIRARDTQRDGSGVRAQGFYVALGYYVFEPVQVGLRFGHLDPDVSRDVDPGSSSTAKDELFHYEAVANYLIAKHEAKLQLSYSRFQYDQRKPTNDIIFAAQVAF